MRTAFAVSRHQIVGETANVENVDIARAVPAPVMRCIDKMAVSVCMWADQRLEHRARGRIKNRCDVMATTTAHPQQGGVVSFIAVVVQRISGHGFAGSSTLATR